MNITFDVAEKLFPNIFTVIIQLCSTGVIFIVAYKFLWNPAREFLAAKAELTQKELNEAKAKRFSNSKANSRVIS